jgi:bifunctional pyridoxal-dependent enzyme with beta-cystathionase and maltose regulon repressor activities
VQVDLLEQLIVQHRPKMIYLIPTFGNPSGGLLSLERRLKVLELAVRHQVLVVEDDDLNQTIVCHLLRHAGYLSTAVGNGTQALALLRERTFDLVLMDWQMPDMDGL